MNQGKTVFSQMMQFLPHAEFQNCVRRYNLTVADFRSSAEKHQ